VFLYIFYFLNNIRNRGASIGGSLIVIVDSNGRGNKGIIVNAFKHNVHG